MLGRNPTCNRPPIKSKRKPTSFVVILCKAVGRSKRCDDGVGKKIPRLMKFASADGHTEDRLEDRDVADGHQTSPMISELGSVKC